MKRVLIAAVLSLFASVSFAADLFVGPSSPPYTNTGTANDSGD